MGQCNNSVTVVADGGARDQRMQSDHATEGAIGEEGVVEDDEGQERLGDSWDRLYFVRGAGGRGSVSRERKGTKQLGNEWQLQWQQEARR